MIVKVKGIIISGVDYSESSRILQIFTKEYGKIGVIAKGAKSLKSPLRATTSNLTYGYFHIYYKEQGLSTLKEVDVLDDFHTIKKDLFKIGYLTYIIDLTNQLLKEEQNNKEIYDLVEASILKISQGFDPLVITSILEIKYLSFLGVKPVLDKCSMCGETNDLVTLSSSSGGLICKKCYQNEYIVDKKTIKLLKLFEYVDISKIKELNIKDINKREINDFLEDYYTRYTGLYLKSKSFINQIKEHKETY